MYASPRESATPARYVFSFFYIHTAHTIICTSAINGIFIKIRLFCNVNFSLLHVRDSTYVCICVSINCVFFSRKNCGHERDEGAVNYPLCVCGYKGKCFSYSRAFFLIYCRVWRSLFFFSILNEKSASRRRSCVLERTRLTQMNH